MISTLTIRNLAGTDQRTYILAAKGAAHVEGPSASGKSTLTHGLLCLLCGDPPNRRNGAAETMIEATTAKGTVLAVRATKTSTAYFRNGEPMQKAAYMAALGNYGGESVRLILAPMAWRSLATGTAQPLRDALARILPAGDIPARVRAIMGDDWSEGDPCDPKSAAEAQTQINAAKDRAQGREQEARNALARANVPLPDGPSAEQIADAATIIAAVREWQAYDAANAPWRAHAIAVARWEQRTPSEGPAYDAPAHQAARMTVARLEAEERAAHEAQLQAEAGAAAVLAERERAAAAERAAKVARNTRRDARLRCAECGQTLPSSSQES